MIPCDDYLHVLLSFLLCLLHLLLLQPIIFHIHSDVSRLDAAAKVCGISTRQLTSERYATGVSVGQHCSRSLRSLRTLFCSLSTCFGLLLVSDLHDWCSGRVRWSTQAHPVFRRRLLSCQPRSDGIRSLACTRHLSKTIRQIDGTATASLLSRWRRQTSRIV